jgi:hypothetical protein
MKYFKINKISADGIATLIYHKFDGLKSLQLEKDDHFEYLRLICNGYSVEGYISNFDPMLFEKFVLNESSELFVLNLSERRELLNAN